MERLGVVDVGKGLFYGDGNAEKRAKRCPPEARVKDEETLRGQRLLDLANVFGKDAQRMGTFSKPAVEGTVPDHVVDNVVPVLHRGYGQAIEGPRNTRQHRALSPSAQTEDRGQAAGVPAFGVPYRQNDLCLGMRLG